MTGLLNCLRAFFVRRFQPLTIRERYEAAQATLLLYRSATDAQLALFAEGDDPACDSARLLEIVLIIEPDAEYAERLYYMTAP